MVKGRSYCTCVIRKRRHQESSMGSPIVSVSREKDVIKNGQWAFLLYLCKQKKTSPKIVNGRSYCTCVNRKRCHQESRMGSPIVSVSREKDVTKNGQWKVLLYLCKQKKTLPRTVNGKNYCTCVKRKRRHQKWSMGSPIVSREKDVTKNGQWTVLFYPCQERKTSQRNTNRHGLSLAVITLPVSWEKDVTSH